MAEDINMTQAEFDLIPRGEATIIDMRDSSSTAYGAIPGAMNIPSAELLSSLDRIDPARPVILYCARGIFSVEATEQLRAQGFKAYSLEDGYAGWVMYRLNQEQEDSERCRRIEESIRKTYHRRLFSQFAKAINAYDLLKPGDHVAVCISGGKDSMLMAKLFQELKRHNKFDFSLTFLCMDPGYNPANRSIIEHNARLLGIPLTIFETDIFDIVYGEEKNPCYLCARMRRGHLYSKARELGCNKIALGHHYDDVIETILMGMLYGAQVQTMMPKLHSTNFPGMELIRPLYFIRESDIKAWRDSNDLHFIQCACRFTDTCTTCDPDGRSVSKRMEIKNLIAQMKKVNPVVEANIFRSMENVNLDTVISYKTRGQVHSFLDDYDERG